MNVADLLQLRAAGAVKRFHTAKVKAQSLASHSWGVAVLLLAVMPDCSKTAVEYALTHDLPELDTGDAPANAKWAEPALETSLRKMEARFTTRYALATKSDLTPLERDVVKWCDQAELYAYCAEQLAMGNRYAIEIMTAIRGAIAERGIPDICKPAMTILDGFAADARYGHGLPGNVALYAKGPTYDDPSQ